MIFKQFHQESLGHASYLVGSEQTGEALFWMCGMMWMIISRTHENKVWKLIVER